MISVCLATFNGELFIRQQLESILRSPMVSEVLVSDDGSTDGTLDRVRAIGDPRVRVMQGPREGPARNFESVLQQAAGDLIFLSDQDDVWLPRKVETMAAALRTTDLAVCNCKVVDADLVEMYPSFFALRRSGPGVAANLFRNSYLGCCMAFRREVLDRALPFPPALPMHDWWLGLVAESFGSVVFIDEPLVLYRRHGRTASVTAATDRLRASRLTQMRWRVRLVWSLLKRRLANA